MPSLQHDVDQRVGDGVQSGLGHQGDQFGDIVIVHRMHRGQVRSCHPPLQAQPRGFIGQRFHMAAKGVIAFVAMHIHHQPALFGDFTQQPHGFSPVLHGAFKMRDATHHIDPAIQRAGQVFQRGRVAQHTILRKGNQLQVQIGRNLFAHLDQRIHALQVIVANVHMAADRADPHCHGQIAIAQGALDDLVHRLLWLQLAPQRDPFQQSARNVHPWPPQRKCCVHMKMRVHKGRANQLRFRIQHRVGLGLDVAFNRNDFAILAGDAMSLAAIRQGGVGDKQVKSHGVFLLSVALEPRMQQGAGVFGFSGNDHQRNNRQNIGRHQEYLRGHNRARLGLQAHLKSVEHTK